MQDSLWLLNFYLSKRYHDCMVSELKMNMMCTFFATVHCHVNISHSFLTYLHWLDKQMNFHARRIIDAGVFQSKQRIGCFWVVRVFCGNRVWQFCEYYSSVGATILQVPRLYRPHNSLLFLKYDLTMHIVLFLSVYPDYYGACARLDQICYNSTWNPAERVENQLFGYQTTWHQLHDPEFSYYLLLFRVRLSLNCMSPATGAENFVLGDKAIVMQSCRFTLIGTVKQCFPFGGKPCQMCHKVNSITENLEAMLPNPCTR